MNTKLATSILTVGFALSVDVLAAPLYTPISFAGTDNIGATLIAGAQTGAFITTNSFATPFDIPATGNNYFETFGPLTITGLHIANPTNIFTLMNAYAPNPGSTIGSYTFKFSDGSSTGVSIIAGVNVRDFYQNPVTRFSNSFTAPYVQNDFIYTNRKGGGGTGDTSTGPTGTYVIDEQNFDIASFALGKTLIEIDLISPNSGAPGGGTGLPILLGLTVESAAVPEPNSLAILPVSVVALLCLRQALKSCHGLALR